jgi:hypothetical protein
VKRGAKRARRYGVHARVALLVLAGATGATWGETAIAEPEAGTRPVFVERSTCEGPAFTEISAVLRVELLNRLLEQSQPDAYRAILDCTGDSIAISVTPPHGPAKTRQINLTRSPANVRARVVALSLAELVRDLDREPPPVAVVPVERSPAPPKDTVVAPAPLRPLPPRRRAIELGAFAETSNFRLDGIWLTGGGLRFDYVFRRLCAGFDVAALTTTEHFTQGNAQVFLAYGSPFVAWAEHWGRAQTFLGAGYAVGVARLGGQASDPRAFAGTTTAAWAAPYGFAALAVVVAEGLTIDARGQLGGVTSPVIGEVTGGHDVAIQGLWASAQIGLALAL